MNGLCETSLDLQDKNRIHKAWKSRIHNFIQGPLPWKRIKKLERNEKSLQGGSLEMLLSQTRGQTVFRDFLQSEFCDENLDFWLVCQEFKTCESLEERIRRAARIYEEFVKADSPRQVNLDFYTRETINQSLQHPSPLCFVVAQRKIYSLMENDSFPRFTQSEHYKVLLYAESGGHGNKE